MSRPDDKIVVAHPHGTRHALREMAESLTSEALYNRLLEVTGATTDEGLARSLDENLRTIQRLKDGDGVTQPRLLKFLEVAGYLKIGPEDDVALARARQAARRLADATEELLAALAD